LQVHGSGLQVRAGLVASHGRALARRISTRVIGPRRYDSAHLG
jgi:hypothetical protein